MSESDIDKLLKLATILEGVYESAIEELSRDISADLRRIAARLEADEHYRRNSLALVAKHVHECGSCGRLRECYHQQCRFNALADCDPGFGCHGPTRT